FSPPCRLSRYSQMTEESNSTLPSSVISVGILPSGLKRISSRLAVEDDTSVFTVSMRLASPVSCANTITLRTNGDRGDQWSFISSLSKEFRRPLFLERFDPFLVIVREPHDARVERLVLQLHLQGRHCH